MQGIRRSYGREPCLSDFSRYVNEETILVNDPIFSIEAVQEYVTYPEKKLNKHKEIGNVSTHSTKEVFICPLCDGKHNLDKCKSFKEKGLLCYGCFSPISARHNARNCKKSKECKVCKKRHPTSLHDYKAEIPKEKLEKSREEKDNKQKEFHCAIVNMSLEVISMCMVPVMVRHKLSNRVVKTYAMLNTCSQVTFAKEKSLSDLGIQGRKTSITIKTMNGEVTKSSEALEDLEVAQASNGKAERVWVKLPCTYTQEDLPVDSNEVATNDKIKRWGYLDKIKAEVNANDSIEVTLLIGAHCVKALEPRELIANKNGGPYAFRTLLRWCIVEPSK